MDDLDLLSRLRADVPGLTPHAADRVRARLAAGSGTRPAEAVPITTRRRAGFVAAAVAAVLVGGVAVAGLRTGDGPGGASAAAAEVLDRAATAALRSDPVPQPGPGQVVYRWEVSGQVAGSLNGAVPAARPDHLCVSARETWMPVDPQVRVRIRDTYGIMAGAAGADPARMRRDPQCPPGVETQDVGTAADDEYAGPAALGRLPVDPRALYEHMRAQAADHGSGPDEETFTLLVDVARSASPYLTPQLVAAVFRALTYVPGVQLLGPGTDMLGRAGVVVGRADAKRGLRIELIVDPATGRMLGKRETITVPDFTGPSGPALPVGTVFSQSVITAAVVGRVGQRPGR